MLRFAALTMTARTIVGPDSARVCACIGAIIASRARSYRRGRTCSEAQTANRGSQQEGIQWCRAATLRRFAARVGQR